VWGVRWGVRGGVWCLGGARGVGGGGGGGGGGRVWGGGEGEGGEFVSISARGIQSIKKVLPGFPGKE